MRARPSRIVALGALVGLLGAVALSAPADASTAAKRSVPAPATLTVGSVSLTPCDDVLAGAWCGSVRRAWDPSGAFTGTFQLGFAFVPASGGRQKTENKDEIETGFQEFLLEKMAAQTSNYALTLSLALVKYSGQR